MDENTPTLRDLFALHAPPVPEWFQPDMPPRPTLPALPSTTPDGHAVRDEVGALILGWVNDPVDDVEEWAREGYPGGEFTGDEIELIDIFANEFRSAWHAMSEWDAERERQTLIQWPYAWADLQAGRP